MNAVVPLRGGSYEIRIATAAALDVREANITEGANMLTDIRVLAVSQRSDIDLAEVIGEEASFRMTVNTPGGPATRKWTGVCRDIELVRAETSGLTTYEIHIAPTLWLATQRRNHRIFQHKSELEIALEILRHWNVEPEVRLDAESYKKRKYRVQYAESDYDFVCRMLEQAGITFLLHERDGKQRLVLCDAPERADKRSQPLTFVDTPSLGGQLKLHATGLSLGRRVRPHRYTMRDHDYRRPARYPLLSSAAVSSQRNNPLLKKMERFHYVPGAFLFRTEANNPTPHADDRGAARTDEREAKRLAENRLAAKRAEARRLAFSTNAHDVTPGTVLSISGHPHPELHGSAAWLVLSTQLQVLDDPAQGEQEVELYVEAVSASAAYRPPLRTKRPRVEGVESATVVGPKGEEIHTDEFGRVRVHFHWDRESRFDERSSCWIHVSQPWGGAGFGGTNLPRVGQEVLVSFLGGDPDRPIVVGRVYTNLQKTPYALPANKTRSGWRSCSSPHTGGYNEIMFEDAAGREVFSMQAERDRQTLVKRDDTTEIGRDRKITVKRHDTESVMGRQSVTVKEKRQVRVLADHDHYVKKTYRSDVKNRYETAIEEWNASAKTIHVTAGDKLQLMVGDSTIIMTPDFIVIDAPDVFINPGADQVSRAREGRRPLYPAELKRSAGGGRGGGGGGGH